MFFCIFDEVKCIFSNPFYFRTKITEMLQKTDIPTLLIIDDEEKIRTLLSKILVLEGYEVLKAMDLQSASKILSKENQKIDVILCDVKLPDGSGIDFTQRIKSQFPQIEIILLTAYGSIPDGVQAMKNGAFDYLVKGDDNEKIIPLVAKAVQKVKSTPQNSSASTLTSATNHLFTFETIIGENQDFLKIKSMAEKVAKTDTTVLILGETGTGKELFAQAIHSASARKEKPFMAINCSAFGKDILESELFGHRAGAFTGAIKDKKGLFEEANQGTVFLDEVGEMNLELQAKLLRVLETQRFIKVGDTKTTQINVRIIAATNRNLLEDAQKNYFRQDLYYRLSVFTIQLPALRERKSDILLLASHFKAIFAHKMQKNKVSFSPSAIQKLQNYTWQGNIRELRNVIERSMILVESENTIEAEDIWLDKMNEQNLDSEDDMVFELKEIEKKHIQKILHYTQNNKTETARLLGIGLTTLYRKLEEFKMED